MGEVEQVIVGARWKYALMTVGSLAFVAGGVWLLDRAYESPKAFIGSWGAIVFFGFCAVMGAAMTWKPPRLRLTADALVVEPTFGRPRRHLWADIDCFLIWQVRRSRGVGLRYVEGRRKRNVAAAALGFDYDASLPTGWPMSTDALAARLTEFKARRAAA
ncbi:STM3941 family protein [Caulobacter sp. 17J80-11]|uniref:STM3941 family protein n=1 Tax=Caulobacter sp. 17J80-11 TaxID=2763502 RepID=UPI0016539420|nr:hypothetical protein [Caulobacter sp. 17J80-11]